MKSTSTMIAVLISAGWIGVGCGEGKTPAAADPIPPALHSLESTAEHGFDAALVSDITTTKSDLTKMETDWSAYRPRALADGLQEVDARRIDAALVQLKKVISEQLASSSPSPSIVVVARAANSVSAPMDVLFAIYKPVTPTELIRLDYLGREILLDSRDAKLEGARAHLTSAQAAFATIEQRIIQANGKKEAEELRATLAAIDSAITSGNAAAVEASAKKELDVVDQVEAVFVKPVDEAD